MIDNKTAELRQWGAELMGWNIEAVFLRITPPAYTDKDKTFICYVKDWTPDLPESGQIWLVVEKMRKKGFIEFSLVRWPNGEEWSATFNGYSRWDKEPCRAILLAAKAALEAQVETTL